MKHKLRFRERKCDRCHTYIETDIREFDCELGSGIKDKTGREIFEGDLIKNPNCNPNDVMDTPEYVIAYDPEEMAFVYRDPVLHRNNCEPFPNDLLSDFNGELEVIGHADENRKETEQMDELIKQLNDLDSLLTRQKAELDQALKGLDAWLDAQEANEPDESMIENLNAVDDLLDNLSYEIAGAAEDLESFIDGLKGD